MADPPPQSGRSRPIVPVTGLVLAAGTAVVALWFLYQISGAILLLFGLLFRDPRTRTMEAGA